MLQITIPGNEMWDERKQEFVALKKPVTLQLEHSLVSVAKWEAKWKKPYLSEKEKTYEETVDYIRCMTITQNINPDVYYFLTEKNFSQILEYIQDPMTATTINVNKRRPAGPRRKQITAEIIYFQMITFGIPMEFQKWHLNRLLTLIKVCDIEGSPKQKMSKADILKQNAAINKARRKPKKEVK